MEPLERSFFDRSTSLVAHALVGHRIVARGPEGSPVVARIVETEAYLGPEDSGSHARRGRETQAQRLWGPPGIAYVYICYGVHQMLNVAAHEADGVGAVLIRAAEPVEGLAAMRARRSEVPRDQIASGPGNLAKALGVTRQAHDGVDLTEAGALYLAEGTPADAGDIAVTGRIGLSEGSELMLRFIDATSDALSRPAPSRDRPPDRANGAGQGAVETSHNG